MALRLRGSVYWADDRVKALVYSTAPAGPQGVGCVLCITNDDTAFIGKFPRLKNGNLRLQL